MSCLPINLPHTKALAITNALGKPLNKRCYLSANGKRGLLWKVRLTDERASCVVCLESETKSNLASCIVSKFTNFWINLLCPKIWPNYKYQFGISLLLFENKLPSEGSLANNVEQTFNQILGIQRVEKRKCQALTPGRKQFAFRLKCKVCWWRWLIHENQKALTSSCQQTSV